jgi:RNA polymerase sigma-70 factor (ECF subfamily)
MSEEGSPLHDLIRRVRSDDQDAATEIVAMYQPHVLRAVRLRMRDSRLRLALDPVDVCQSVMASFFARLLLGQFDVDSPEQLIRLLEKMARNKVASQARKAQVTRREIRGVDAGADRALPQASSVPDPSRVVAERDLLEQFQRRMSHEERRLSDLRGSGREWSEIAEEVGSSPAALRKKLARALDRIARELGLDDDDE